MRLTKNFTYEELIASPTAKRFGIDNSPSKTAAGNLQMLANEILQPIRDAYGKSIVVSSGFRCPRLNAAVGGSATSDHKFGCAADIRSMSDTPTDNRKLWRVVVDLWKAGKLPRLKQCINEYGFDWVHVSIQDGRTSKLGEFLDAKRINKKTTYSSSGI